MSVDPAVRVGERYEIISRAGSGGMADVYRARDTMLDRDVALKVLRTSNTSEQDRERFVAEGRILAQLSHPNLVTLLDVGISDEPFLVMEYVDGATLAEQPGPLDLATVASIGMQLAEALTCAHDAGVVHRDVKPGNVLLGPDGRTRLADFGIARLLEDSARHTAEGLTVGTAAYVAPEQVTQGSVGPAADIYSLGLVLLEGITGERAYPGPPIEAAVARLTVPAPIPGDLPPDWQRLLRRMTATVPGDRPDAAAVVAALRELSLPGSEATVMVAPVPPPIAVPAASVGARLLRLGALAAAVLIGVCALSLALAGRGVEAVDAAVPAAPPSPPKPGVEKPTGGEQVKHSERPSSGKAGKAQKGQEEPKAHHKKKHAKPKKHGEPKKHHKPRKQAGR